jgi:uncharacterized cofD-like protein
VATTAGSVCAVRLTPEDPPACAEAVQAVLDADVVVLGPGSWFTSVLPHLLVPDLRDALVGTHARRVVALNLAPQAGETDGFSPETHLEVLAAHAPDLVVDVVLADLSAVLDTRGGMSSSSGHVHGTVAHSTLAREALQDAVESAGGRLVLADVSRGDGTPRHDPVRLAEAYASILGTHVKEDRAWR